MKYRSTFFAVLLLLACFLLTGNIVSAQEGDDDSWEQTIRSWSLQFEAQKPQIFIHQTERGERIPYIYIVYTLRNNFDSPVPLNLNVTLQAGGKRFTPVTSDPDVEREIIVEKANLQGFSERVKSIKIRKLKQNGRFLNWDELNRGSVMRKNLEGDWESHAIKQLAMRNMVDGKELTLKENSSESQDPDQEYEQYEETPQLYLKAGPDDREGKPFSEHIDQHPAEIKGLLLFRNVDLTKQSYKLKVGGLMDMVVRVPKIDTPPMKQFMLEPHTLHITWTWDVPRNTKLNTDPIFHSRKMHQERFGPLASRDTLKKLIDFIAMPAEDLGVKKGKTRSTMRATALRTLQRLTDQSFGYNPEKSVEENQEAIERWNEWWFRNKHDLLYVVDTKPSPSDAYSEEAYQKWFNLYPEPKYIVVKKKMTVPGGETPKKIFTKFREAWNNENWQTVVDTLIVDQRSQETLKKLLERYGYDSEIGYPRGNVKDLKTANRKLIEFNFKKGTRKIFAEKDQDEWYLRIIPPDADPEVKKSSGEEG